MIRAIYKPDLIKLENNKVVIFELKCEKFKMIGDEEF